MSGMTDARALDVLTQYSAQEGHPKDFEDAISHISARLRDLGSDEECQLHREAHRRIDSILIAHSALHIAHEGDQKEAWENTIEGVTRLRGDGEQGQAVAFGHWLQDCNGVGYFTRHAAPSVLNEYDATPGYSAAPLYDRPQPVAGDAVRALPAKWRGHMEDADHFNIKGSYTLRQCADELEVALSTQPAPSEQVAASDLPPPGAPFVGCQCPTCGEEFAASAASVAVPDWQPIETAPRDGTEILAWDGEDRIVTHWCKFRDGFGDPYEGWIHPNIGELGPSLAMPTHWQTLAAAPVAPKQEVIGHIVVNSAREQVGPVWRTVDEADAYIDMLVSARLLHQRKHSYTTEPVYRIE